MTDHGATAAHNIARSPQWPKVEHAHREKFPTCAACAPGSLAAIQVHHIFPFHYAIALGRPDLELDDRNLISLCETEAGRPSQNHHLLIGHLGDFKEGNLFVKQDAAETWHGKSELEIKADIRWKSAVQNARLKALDLMTQAEKDALRALMDKTFPKE